VVLTADGTLMADYRTLLDGMVAAAQTTMVPGVVMKRLLAPPLRGRKLPRWDCDVWRRRS